MTAKQVHVAVGVIVRNQQVFVCKRAESAHQGGLWEFPGGKIEERESPEQALSRELLEEVDITVKRAAPLLNLSHDYSDKSVHLHVFKVTLFKGTATGKEGQPHEWRDVSALDEQDFPAANKSIINLLKQQL